MRARALVAALVALVVAGGGAAGAQAAATSTITACVKTKTGTVKILTTAKARKKKCPKGTKKMTWNVPGRAGADGKNGTNGSSENGSDGTNGTNGANGTHASPLHVYGPDGRVLGQFAGLAGGHVQFNAYSVMVDGGLYTYVPEGMLSNSASYLDDGGGPVYTNAACTGLPLITLPRRYADTLNRSTYRYVETQIFTANVWRAGSTSTVPAAAPTYYAVDVGTGNCLVATGVHAGDSLVDLVLTTSPPVLVGPLTIAP